MHLRIKLAIVSSSPLMACPLLSNCRQVLSPFRATISVLVYNVRGYLNLFQNPFQQ